MNCPIPEKKHNLQRIRPSFLKVEENKIAVGLAGAFPFGGNPSHKWQSKEVELLIPSDYLEI